jgi:hypothetical protein
MNLTRYYLSLLTLVMWMAACTPVLTPTPLVPIKVQYSFAAQPWLEDLQDCAVKTIIEAEKRAIDFQDLDTADLLLRIGEASDQGEAFQIGTEEIVVISHPENPVAALTALQVQGVFSGIIHNWAEVGGDDLSIQVWVFAAGEDIQRIFLESGLSGTPITTYALLAATPEAMLRAILADQGAIGLMPRKGITEEANKLYSITEIPVIAILREGAPESVTEIIACLQK